ncbi:hypothetical protein DOT_5170 [Desulfosporosinus sp. OT]|nr:hypothetical protein DOT_5170 [Desulfosporosinus sp. OT]
MSGFVIYMDGILIIMLDPVGKGNLNDDIYLRYYLRKVH